MLETDNKVGIHDGQNSKIVKTNEKTIEKRAHWESVWAKKIVGFKNEVAISNQLGDIEGVRKAISYELKDGAPSITLEYFDGCSLKEFHTSNNIGVELFLDIAIKIVRALHLIHQKHVIHKDVNTSNILINPDSKEIVFIDFEIAASYDAREEFLGNPEKLEGTLAYISPEQTGRMNRIIDNRSDLYSLGMVFYELLTGKLPFESEDPMELVHAHIAKIPASVKSVDDSIPEVISNIIDKLIKKNAEDRYLAAAGLLYDLEQVQGLIQEGKDSSSFVIGQRDFSGKLVIPEKLYGREKEIDELLFSFNNVANGSKELILIRGYSGTGKSFLVSEIHQQLSANNVIYAAGKFDLLNRDIPYNALTQAFKGLAQNLLTESETVINEWKQILQEELGEIGGVITDLVPDFNLIIGEQPAPPELEGDAAQKRLQFAIKKLISAFLRKANALALFIDDLQWADNASLDLIEQLMQDSAISNLLLIGAYRNNEVDEQHPLTELTNRIEPKQIDVLPLEEDSIRLMMADGLQMSLEGVKELSELVHEKTRGNVFFVKQFLKNLNRQDYLRFDFKNFAWTWDVNKIHEMGSTGNVVELMAKEVKSIAPDVREVLKIASGIGNRFDLETLGVITEKSSEELVDLLFEGVKRGFIQPIQHSNIFVEGQNDPKDFKYKFIHDKFQESFYNLFEEGESERISYKMGTLLLSKYSEEELNTKVFDVANYFNAGYNLVQNGNKDVIQLYLNAGLRARNSAAYDNAYSYLKNAVTLLGNNSWNEDYEITLNLYSKISDVSFLQGNTEEMEKYVEIIFSNARSVVDKSEAYITKILAYNSKHRLREVVDIGVKAISELGIKLPKKPGLQHVLIELGRMKRVMIGKKVEGLIDLPEMTDKKIIAAHKIMMAIGSAAMFVEPGLLPILAIRGTYLSVKYGRTDNSDFNYTGYGMILCGALKSYDEGYKFGKLGLAVAEKFKSGSHKVKPTNLYYTSVAHFKDAYTNSIDNLRKNYRRGMEVGDLEYAFYSLNNYCFFKYFCGHNLEEVLYELQTAKTAIENAEHNLTLSHIRSYVAAVEKLVDPDAPLTGDLTTDWYNETEIIKEFSEKNDLSVLFISHFNKVKIAYLGGHISNAIKNIEIADKNVEGGIAQPNTNVLELYKALSFAQSYRTTGNKKHLSKAKKAVKLLKTLDKHAHVNFGGKLELALGELERAQGNEGKAIAHFENAISFAKQEKIINEEALANELIGSIYFDKKQITAAKAYLNKAYRLYDSWGANAKLTSLKNTYETLELGVFSSSSSVNQTSTYKTTQSDGTSSLDLNSILKASKVIMGEIRLDELLKKLMHLVIENAGAEKGVLILLDDNNWLVQATLDNKQINVLLNQSYNDPETENVVCKPIVNYVMHAKVSEVLENAQNGKYQDSAYVKQQSPLSILCLPLLNKGVLKGILYLENNQTTGAFSQDLVQTLQMMSSQIAVSIENALLYENLEKKVQKRTAEVRMQKEIIEQKNENIVASIQYAKRIQSSMLPQDVNLDRSFKDVGVLFKPCHIVSGDFYYFAEKDGKQIIAAIDCTGHGVPGGFMSMAGNAVLNQIVHEKGITQADQILYALNNGIVAALKQKETDNQDGMDMALCVLDEANGVIQFAGAKNPMVFVEGGELTPVKGSKSCIGGGGYRKRDIEKSYELQEFKYVTGKCIYLFSDGYQDQFGGPDGGKFMRRKMYQMLLEHHDKPMKDQVAIWDEAIESWKGDLEQTDDILVIGIRT